MKTKLPPIWYYRKAIDDYLSELERYCRQCVPMFGDSHPMQPPQKKRSPSHPRFTSPAPPELNPHR